MKRTPLKLKGVLRCLLHPEPLTVRDSGGGSYVGGRWVPEPESTRRIRAAVLQMRPEELQMLGHGHISGGGIVLHTEAELYFTDLLGQGETQQRRQSYVNYQGYGFRVIGTGFVRGNADFNTYRAVRYDAR